MGYMSAEFELHEHQREVFAPPFYQLRELTRCLKGGLKLKEEGHDQRLYYWLEKPGFFGLAYFNGRGLCFNMKINRQGVQEMGVLDWNRKGDFRVRHIIHFDHPDKRIGNIEVLADVAVKHRWDLATTELIDKFTNSFLSGKAQLVVPESQE